MTIFNKLFRRLFFSLALTTVAMAQENSPAADQYPDVRVLESTDYGVTLEFKPKYLPAQTIVVDRNDYQTVRIERGSSWDYADAGKPDVRFRTIALGLPGMTNNRVTVIAADYATVSGFSLAPVPTIIPAKSPVGTLSRESSGPQNEFYPAIVVSLNAVAIVKGVSVGYLRIFPAQYNSVTRTLKKYSRLVIRIDFGPRQPAATSSDDEWMKRSLLNYPQVKRSLQNSSTLAKRTAVNSALSSGNWYKLEVREDGMYKIDATYLRTLGIDRGSIASIRDLKIYGNNGLALPENLLQPRAADLTMHAALYVDVNGNGKFDDDDYILFYGQGITGWTYLSFDRDFSHYTNPYTNSNFYFLQYAPQNAASKEMSTVQTPSSGVTVSTTVGKIFFDEERTNVTHSGLEWYSAPMNPNDSRVIANKLNGYLAGTPVRYKYEMLSRSDVTTAFNIEESGVQIASLFIAGIDPGTLAGDPVYNYANRNQGQVLSIPSLTDSRSAVKIVYNANSMVATGYINWLELLYTQQLVGINEALIFTSPDTTAAVQYALSGFSGNKFSVFDITEVLNVKIVSSQADQIAGTYLFRDNLSAGSVKRYWAGTSSAYKTPASFVRIPNTNLRGVTSVPNFIIITHRDFLAEAQRLKSFKENLPGGDALKTIVVEVDTIYNEFGGGIPDPVAIRDFLKYATTNWPQASGQPAPGYVLFFGDACFDFKNILGIDRNWVPTYQTPESDYQIETYGYDDFFAYLTPGDIVTVTIAHGRLPVRTAAEARLEVDRIIQYESAPSFGTWKNLITVVSDDRNVNGELDGADNPEQAEALAVSYIPSLFEVKKIYEEDYPMVFSSAGRVRPDARQALLDQINKGTLVLNFTGHGNPKVWSHESILTKDDVINQLSNGNRLALIVAATCDWGRYDEAGEQSSAEEAIVNPNGGAIGVISANRAVYSSDNAATNYALYSHLFSRNPFNPTLRLGDGLMLAKNDRGSGAVSNNRKYHLLGDPTLRLSVPRLVTQIDSINGMPVGSGFFDTLQALSKITIKASLRDTNGIVQNINSDSALVSVFDAERTAFVFDSEPKVQHSFSFVKPGAIIYKGDNTIRNGRLSATFIVPKDISYENKQGRISVYFSASAADGRGFTDQVIVGGTATTFANDTQGPTIRIFFDSRSFRSGDVVGDNPQLIVDLADSSGINSAGSSIGHRLEAWLDGNPKSADLTEFYRGAKDNYQAGSIEYQYTGLVPGRHTIRIRAWDVYNNSSTEQVDFIVASSTALTLENIYNIPNPVHATTTFTFQHNQLSGVDVEIKIYTVSGRLIQSISSEGYSNRFVQIPWDCRDRDGAKIGNGTYLYKIIAKTVDGKYASEALGKLSIVR
jgi:hypothetical protein